MHMYSILLQKLGLSYIADAAHLCKHVYVYIIRNIPMYIRMYVSILFHSLLRTYVYLYIIICTYVLYVGVFGVVYVHV